MRRRSSLVPCLLLLASASIAPLAAATKDEAAATRGRTYDLRLTLPPTAAAVNPGQEAAIASYRAANPDTRVTRDVATGVVRTIFGPGYLSAPMLGQSAEAVAERFVRERLALLGLSADDLDGMVVSRITRSEKSGLTHVHFRQVVNGLRVAGATLQVSVKDDGRVLSLSNQFLPGASRALNQGSADFAAADVLGAVAANLRVGRESLTVTRAPRLEVLPIRAGEARLVWNVVVDMADKQHWYEIHVDAADGRIWTRFDWVDSDSYRVYQMPVESPNHTTPLPPGDGRTLQANPADVNASPFAWHDTNGAAGAEFTTTQGNNVHAYTDTDANNTPDAGSSPDGGASLLFDFPLDLTLAPSGYRPAAVTNLFYWNNIQHDVLYQYGFDEASGNFQENNYGNGGLGSDSVNAEAQDGAGTNNANFATPDDGQNPRMQMFIWTAPTPDRDGDIDNGIILHEYGHGVSNRLTGDSVNCLDNSEQMGEGWSDWMTVWFTALASHTPTTNRGVGTYALNQAVNGPGIRPAPYNTDMAVNNFTYSNLGAAAIPHGVGFIWNTMLWEVYWELVTEHGFDTDFYDGDGGNNLAMQLVIDGMKIQPCSPGFVDGRDAILAADVALTGGDNQCLIWEAFAKRGLGDGASQGSNNSTSDGTASFDMPNLCEFLGTVDAEEQICAGSPATYPIGVGTAFTPPVTLAATGNPAPSTVSFSPNPVNSPPATSTLTVGNTAAVAPGSYVINVTGNGDAVNSINVDLDVFAGTPAAASLVAPLDFVVIGTTQPTFSWGAVANSTGYDLEIDDNADFSSPIYTQAVSGTSHSPGTPLPDDVLLYWRVRAGNPCGDGANSATRRLMIGLPVEVCRNPGVAIPDNNPTGVSDVLNVAAGAVLPDLDVKLVFAHTWPGDLKATLNHGATTVELFDRPGVPASTFGCSTDNVDVTVNDEGPDGNIESFCNGSSPGIQGNRIGADPAGSDPLSAFDGVSSTGNWTLTVSDHFGSDTGNITSWCLVVPDSMPFIDSFESNDTSAWTLDVP